MFGRRIDHLTVDITTHRPLVPLGVVEHQKVQVDQLKRARVPKHRHAVVVRILPTPLPPELAAVG
eukprot:877361-Prorocentrum_minimum.AAC.1